VPPRLAHACEWKYEAEIALVYLGEGLLKEHGAGGLATVIGGDFQRLARLDACLWSLGEIFRGLCRGAARPPVSFIEGIGTALASRTLEQHFRARRNAARALPRLSDRGLRRMMEYTDAHLSEPIAVADLARHVAFSVDHFARLLKNTTGLSPLQFLLKRRVEKALELLRTGQFRVAEAACEVGFYDQSHLDRHCRKFFGFPPKVAMRAAAMARSS
jgi:AraC family transcriptional regulator